MKHPIKTINRYTLATFGERLLPNGMTCGQPLYVCLENKVGNANIELDRIVGKVTRVIEDEAGLAVEWDKLDTPCFNVVKGLMDFNVDLVVRPVGLGRAVLNEVKDYTLLYFSIGAP